MKTPKILNLNTYLWMFNKTPQKCLYTLYVLKWILHTLFPQNYHLVGSQESVFRVRINQLARTHFTWFICSVCLLPFGRAKFARENCVHMSSSIVFVWLCVRRFCMCMGECPHTNKSPHIRIWVVVFTRLVAKNSLACGKLMLLLKFLAFWTDSCDFYASQPPTRKNNCNCELYDSERTFHIYSLGSLG